MTYFLKWIATIRQLVPNQSPSASAGMDEDKERHRDAQVAAYILTFMNLYLTRF